MYTHYMLSVVIFINLPLLHTIYVVDPNGIDRRFDGIGGISGGGATSKLLVNYPEPQRSQILDFLFLPNFGASLHILKVEIGGDAQTTDGTESSHMHEPWDENYQRGYEWWIMKEAKKRNPNIKLYGLAWAFPGWVGKGTADPYLYPTLTATYITNWLNAAKVVHNLTIDYVGIWNERPYDIAYIKLFRKLMNENQNLKNIKIVAADDGDWSILNDLDRDKEFYDIVDYIGVHYPGTQSPTQAKTIGKPIWASEDYSTFNNDVGAGCWARILNGNYVNGLMTSTISWNLIASYYDGLPFKRNGLMTANQPWSGHYNLSDPIWVSAHTTQFVSPGWHYLKNNSGSGNLSEGGTFVTLVSPDKKDITMIVETFSHDHAICVRPPLPPYNVSVQQASFNLTGNFATLTKLNVWFSKFEYGNEESKVFSKLEPVEVIDGIVVLSLDVDVIYTLTTLDTGTKGTFDAPPKSAMFPLPYKETFDGYELYAEPYNIAPQVGVFEVRETGSNKVMQQVMQNAPITWCPFLLSTPIAVVGDSTWSNISVEVDVNIPLINSTDGVFVAARVDKGGCTEFIAKGVYFFITANQKYIMSLDLERTMMVKIGSFEFKYDTWYRLGLHVSGKTAIGYINGTQVVNIDVPDNISNGFAAIGTNNFGHANFDNFIVDNIK